MVVVILREINHQLRAEVRSTFSLLVYKIVIDTIFLCNVLDRYGVKCLDIICMLCFMSCTSCAEVATNPAGPFIQLNCEQFSSLNCLKL